MLVIELKNMHTDQRNIEEYFFDTDEWLIYDDYIAGMWKFFET